VEFETKSGKRYHITNHGTGLRSIENIFRRVILVRRTDGSVAHLWQQSQQRQALRNKIDETEESLKANMSSYRRCGDQLKRRSEPD
jgi:hypothetical protein